MLATLCVCVCYSKHPLFVLPLLVCSLSPAGSAFMLATLCVGVCVCACIKHPHSVLMNISFTIGHRFLCVLQLASAFSAQEHKLY